MLLVGKMEKMEGEDFYNDDWNIDEMEAKEEISEELKGLMEEWNNIKLHSSPVSSLESFQDLPILSCKEKSFNYLGSSFNLNLSKIVHTKN